MGENIRKSHLEKGMATHYSILAWKSQRQRSLVGYSPRDCKESDTTEWLTLTTNISDKHFMSKIYQELIQLTAKTKQNQKNSIRKWAKDLNKHFPKEDIQMVKRHVKRHSALLISRETEIQTAVSNYLTLVRMAIMKRLLLLFSC